MTGGWTDRRHLVAGVTYEPDAVNTVRHAKVYGAPDIQDPHRPGIRDVMRPTRVEIHLTNEVVTHVCVYGPAVKLNGTPGTKEKLRFYGRQPDSSNPEPEWLVQLVRTQDLRWPGRTSINAYVPAGSDRFA